MKTNRILIDIFQIDLRSLPFSIAHECAGIIDGGVLTRNRMCFCCNVAIGNGNVIRCQSLVK